MEKLSEKLMRLKNSTTAAIELFENFCLPVEFKEGEVMRTRPSRSFNLYFIDNGIFQGVANQPNEDTTIYLATSGFILAPSFFSKKVPSIDYIEFITAASGWAFDMNNLEILHRQNHQLILMLFEIYEEALYEDQQNIMMLRIGNADKRFLYFIDHYPSLIYKIKNEVIASFLNIGDKYLFRIKKKNM